MAVRWLWSDCKMIWRKPWGIQTWLIDRAIDQPTDGWTDWVTDLPTDRSTVELTDQMTDRPTDWLTDSPTDPLIHWCTDPLNDCLSNCLILLHFEMEAEASSLTNDMKTVIAQTTTFTQAATAFTASCCSCFPCLPHSLHVNCGCFAHHLRCDTIASPLWEYFGVYFISSHNPQPHYDAKTYSS